MATKPKESTAKKDGGPTKKVTTTTAARTTTTNRQPTSTAAARHSASASSTSSRSAPSYLRPTASTKLDSSSSSPHPKLITSSKSTPIKPTSAAADQKSAAAAAAALRRRSFDRPAPSPRAQRSVISPDPTARSLSRSAAAAPVRTSSFTPKTAAATGRPTFERSATTLRPTAGTRSIAAAVAAAAKKRTASPARRRSVPNSTNPTTTTAAAARSGGGVGKSARGGSTSRGNNGNTPLGRGGRVTSTSGKLSGASKRTNSNNNNNNEDHVNESLDNEIQQVSDHEYLISEDEQSVNLDNLEIESAASSDVPKSPPLPSSAFEKIITSISTNEDIVNGGDHEEESSKNDDDNVGNVNSEEGRGDGDDKKVLCSSHVEVATEREGLEEGVKGSDGEEEWGVTMTTTTQNGHEEDYRDKVEEETRGDEKMGVDGGQGREEGDDETSSKEELKVVTVEDDRDQVSRVDGGVDSEKEKERANQEEAVEEEVKLKEVKVSEDEKKGEEEEGENRKLAAVEVEVEAKSTPSSAKGGKKESPAAYNDVIEETKNKLMEKRKNKVKALVGAFQTVIDYETTGTSPSKST